MAPCLVILNACRTHGVGPSFKLAEAFTSSGTPACIAMQGNVRGDLAGRFSARVLSGLCNGEALDKAVAQARGELRQDTDVLQRDWAFPVLSLAVPPEQLLPPKLVCAHRDVIANAFRDIVWFVDRREPRRRIRSQLAVNASRAGGSGLLVAAGPPQSGKSHLAKWCAEDFALVHDCLMRYVRLASTSGEHFVHLLERILHLASAGSGDFPGDALNAFHWKRNAILAGQVRREWNGEPVLDPPALDDERMRDENARRDLCKAFLDLLQAAAAARPVVIVLDQFVDGDVSFETSMMKDILVPHLMRPLHEGRVPGVLMVLVMNPMECARYGVESLVPGDRWVRVTPELPEPRERLEDELFWYPDDPVRTQLRQMIDLVAGRNGLPPRTHPRVDCIQRLRRAAGAIFMQSNDPDQAEDDLRTLFKMRQMT